VESQLCQQYQQSWLLQIPDDMHDRLHLTHTSNDSITNNASVFVARGRNL
jgi:hypothetical protein